jgi:hypothetical protein
LGDALLDTLADWEVRPIRELAGCGDVPLAGAAAEKV